MKYNSRSVYNCTEAPAEFTAPANTLLTYNPATKRLYVHLLSYPMDNLVLKNMTDKVKYIQFLHNASEIKYSPVKNDANSLNLSLPILKPNTEIR